MIEAKIQTKPKIQTKMASFRSSVRQPRGENGVENGAPSASNIAIFQEIVSKVGYLAWGGFY